ncbi:hypothetical protein C8Q76DRAFT_699454 [Earliella scabrosa]|nr:hypothetical protein C8Q76DRAFT_699454 [Earliella scabrosa]
MPEVVLNTANANTEPMVKLVLTLVTGEWTGEQELGLYIVVSKEDTEVNLRLPEGLSIAEATPPGYWDHLQSLLHDTGIGASLTEEQRDAVDIVVSLYRFFGEGSPESQRIWPEFWEQIHTIAEVTAVTPQVEPWNLLLNMIPWARGIAKHALPPGMLARWTDPVETGEFDDDDQGGLDEDEDKEEDGGVEAVDAVGEEELAEDA